MSLQKGSKGVDNTNLNQFKQMLIDFKNNDIIWGLESKETEALELIVRRVIKLEKKWSNEEPRELPLTNLEVELKKDLGIKEAKHSLGHDICKETDAKAATPSQEDCDRCADKRPERCFNCGDIDDIKKKPSGEKAGIADVEKFYGNAKATEPPKPLKINYSFWLGLDDLSNGAKVWFDSVYIKKAEVAQKLDSDSMRILISYYLHDKLCNCRGSLETCKEDFKYIHYARELREIIKKELEHAEGSTS